MTKIQNRCDELAAACSNAAMGRRGRSEQTTGARKAACIKPGLVNGDKG